MRGLFSDRLLGDNKSLKNWARWLKQYKQDQADYEIYSLVDEARSHGAEWKDLYSIAGSILTNRFDEETGHPKDNTIRKTREKVLDRMKQEPHRYYPLKTFQKRNDCHPYRKDLWTSIKETIKAGKPKGIKNI